MSESKKSPFASIAWKPDSTGFYYTRHPALGEVPKGEEKYHRQVFEHVIGTDPANDPRVFAPSTDMTDIPAVDLSPDGRWLVVTLYQGWAQSQVHFLSQARDFEFLNKNFLLHKYLDTSILFF